MTHGYTGPLPKTRARPQILRIVAVNLVLLLAGLLGIELTFGDWLAPEKISQVGVVRNVAYEIPLSGLYLSPDPVIRYRRDRFGLRGPYSSVASIDILTIGGSTTDQRYVTEGQTWQDALSNALKANGIPGSIANAGVDGQSTFGHIKNFQSWFPRITGLTPRYILFYIGINDLFKFDGSSYDRLRLLRPPSTLWGKAKESSALLILKQTIEGHLESQARGMFHQRVDFENAAWTAKPLRSDHSRISVEQLRGYRQRIESLFELTRRVGAHPILVTQRFFSYRLQQQHGQVEGLVEARHLSGEVVANGVDMYYFAQAFNTMALQTCNEMRGICIDLATELSFDRVDYYDYVHTTASGSAKIGRFLAEKLSTELAGLSIPVLK